MAIDPDVQVLIDQINTQITGLQGWLSALDDRITTQADLDAATQNEDVRISALESEVDILRSDIAALENETGVRFDALNAAVAILDAAFQQLKAELDRRTNP